MDALVAETGAQTMAEAMGRLADAKAAGTAPGAVVSLVEARGPTRTADALGGARGKSPAGTMYQAVMDEFEYDEEGGEARGVETDVGCEICGVTCGARFGSCACLQGSTWVRLAGIWGGKSAACDSLPSALHHARSARSAAAWARRQPWPLGCPCSRALPQSGYRS